MKRKSLTFKLMASGALAVIVPLLCVGVFAIYKSSDSLEQQSMMQSVEVAKGLAAMADLGVQEEMKIASQIALRDTVIDAATRHAKGNGAAETEKATAELSELVKAGNKEYETVFIAGKDGVIFADGVNGKYKGVNVADRDYVKNGLDGKVNVGTIIKSKVTGQPVLTFGAPVRSKSGDIVGVVGTAVNITFLDKVSSVKIGQTGYGYAVDKNGVIISHPNKDFILSLNLTQTEGMKDFASKMVAGKTDSETYVFKGVKKVAGFAPATLAGWSIGITQDYDELMSPARVIRNVIALIGAIFLAVTLAGVFFLARSISVPIIRISTELNEVSEQIASASSQVSSTSQRLAEGASEQAASLEETSSSLEEMSSMIRQTADNASALRAAADETIRYQKDCYKSIKVTNDRMTETGQAGERATKIIKTIDEIAFQTNLLALNAAVEAARAGEAGAGFAVVASEVRNLAIRAAEAAKTTTGIIEEVTAKIGEGHDLVNKSLESFRAMGETGKKVTTLIQEVATASGEQASGIGQINKAVAEMDKVTQQTASNAEESASASEQMSAQAQQMKSQAAQLAAIIGINGNGQNADRGSSAMAEPQKAILERARSLMSFAARKKSEPGDATDKEFRNF